MSQEMEFTKLIIFILIFAPDINCWCALEPLGLFNEYTKYMFSRQNKEKAYTTVNPSFPYLQWGFLGWSSPGHV